MLWCTQFIVVYCTALHCTVLLSLRSAVLCCIASCCATICYVVLNHAALYDVTGMEHFQRSHSKNEIVLYCT